MPRETALDELTAFLCFCSKSKRSTTKTWEWPTDLPIWKVTCAFSSKRTENLPIQ